MSIHCDFKDRAALWSLPRYSENNLASLIRLGCSAGGIARCGTAGSGSRPTAAREYGAYNKEQN